MPSPQAAPQKLLATEMISKIGTLKGARKIRRNNKLVAIAIPVTERTELTPEEKISLNHLLHFLGDYDKFFIAPTGLGVAHPEIENRYFDRKYFGSGQAHSRLLLSTGFYESFAEYEYLLLCHLDTLVFSDQLSYWCNQDYDYIAPPWIKHEDAPYAGKPEFEGKIGNGGFSLRKIESFLKVLNSKELFKDPEELWANFCRNKSAFRKFLNLPRKFLYRLPKFNNAEIEIARRVKIEDSFWANRALHYYPDFRLAPVSVALQFAFECLPRHCYEQNNHQLPFGCHAWQEYDQEFWEPFLIPDAKGQ